MPPRKRLGQLLTELGVIDEHQLQSALGHQKQWGGKLGAILVQKGFCGEDQLVSALAQHLSMERVKLGETKIDPRAVKLVSKQIAEFRSCALLASKLAKHKQVHEQAPVWLAVLGNQELSKDQFGM